MAKPPVPANDAFLREVDDELRRDRMVAAWRRWGRVGIAALLAALAAFAGWLWWQNRSEKAAAVESEQLQAADDQVAAGQTKQARAALAPLATSRAAGIRALALLTQADTLAQAKDTRAAAAKYAAVASDTSLGQPFRDLALLRQTAVEFDTLPPATVIARLRPLAQPGSAWFGSAGEMTAVAYLRQNRRDLAARLFGQIGRTDTVPESIRQRAVQMATAMGDTAAAPSTGAQPQP